MTEVDIPPIENLCLAGVVPVLPSLAEDDDGLLLNVNADTAAAAVAMALGAEKLVFLTDTPGILMDRNEPRSLVRSLTPEGCRELIDRKVIDKGMIPKVEACLAGASRPGSRRFISSTAGSARPSLLLEMYTDIGIGTEIVPKAASDGQDEPAAAPSRPGIDRNGAVAGRLPRPQTVARSAPGEDPAAASTLSHARFSHDLTGA